MNTIYDLDFPVEQVIKNIYYKFQIVSTTFTLFKSVTVGVSILDENERYMRNTYYIMSGEAYNNYGANDDYLVEWVKLQIQNESR